MSIAWTSDVNVTLALSDLATGSPGMTGTVGAALGEAASVCLADRHSSPTRMAVDGDISLTATIEWESPTDQARRSWDNAEEATEFGACALASLLIGTCSALTIVARSRTRTGFDYWLGRQDDPGPLFQNRARLEVSGIRSGTNSAMSTRTRRKLVQVDQSAPILPAVVIVVEFGEPRSRIRETWTT